jgi:nucleoside-diphosphate-sugar epimerase
MADGLHILITGASGFVGRALVQNALAQGYRVTALVRDAATAPAGCDALVHSLGSGGGFKLPPGVDAVAYLAQSRAYRTFPGDADEMYRVNVAGTQHALMAAAEAGVSRFCLVSSGTVYEPFANGLIEDAPLAPSSNLGATKLAAEVLARPFANLFPVAMLRLFAPFGPGQVGRLVPDLIGRIQRGEAVSLPTEGGGMRFSPTYVDDVCDVMLAALREGWSGAFNVAAPEALTIEEAACAIGAVLDRAPLFERTPISAPNLVPSLAKLGAHYDLARFRSFSEGIVATVVAGR